MEAVSATLRGGRRACSSSGFKHSGSGREDAIEEPHAFLEPKAINPTQALQHADRAATMARS